MKTRMVLGWLAWVIAIALPGVALAAVITCPPVGLCEGTGYDDTIYGNDSYNHIEAYGGSDTVYAYGAADELHGADGYDTMRGGPGNDEVYGGRNGQFGWDNLHGGAGNDSIDDAWGPTTDGTVEFDRGCVGDAADIIDVRDANGRRILEADPYQGGPRRGRGVDGSRVRACPCEPYAVRSRVARRLPARCDRMGDRPDGSATSAGDPVRVSGQPRGRPVDDPRPRRDGMGAERSLSARDDARGAARTHRREPRRGTPCVVARCEDGADRSTDRE